MADQTVKKFISIGTTFYPGYLSLDSTFKILKIWLFLYMGKKMAIFRYLISKMFDAKNQRSKKSHDTVLLR